ncbi:HEPN family nuclease [Vibrio parahaemolyticus]|uniref:HEPN family nuclease n=1 Tax=Vibrio parahaemolyticus TaxID=670 RepID=UPI001121232C|nr:HEPN family nuclease [Vibrio parahaemolyticus]TOB15027.1 hypothetical protein CGK12_23230 [Vibrio parahaemolyticus]
MDIDHRKDIPLGCVINSDIMTFLKRKPAFRSACIEVPKKRNISGDSEEWPFFNISFGFYRMYCLLVVPKELNDLEEGHAFFLDLESKNIMRNFTVLASEYGEIVPIHQMFRLLRNAVSHVNYSINQDDKIEFWNKKFNGDENWRVSIHHNEMVQFLGELELPVIELMRRDT